MCNVFFKIVNDSNEAGRIEKYLHVSVSVTSNLLSPNEINEYIDSRKFLDEVGDERLRRLSKTDVREIVWGKSKIEWKCETDRQKARRIYASKKSEIR